MITDINGQALRIPNTETDFDPKLVELLIALSPLLQMNGLRLACVKCETLGLSGNVSANNHPDDPCYRLACDCATRVFYKASGHEKVIVN